MPTRDRIADMHVKKAESSLAEAETLLGSGFFDGAVSRAGVACVQVMNAAITLQGRADDPENVAECVTVWASDGRLPAAIALYFQVTTLMRREADETCVFATQDNAENSIAGAKHFLQIVQQVVGIGPIASHQPSEQPSIQRKF